MADMKPSRFGGKKEVVEKPEVAEAIDKVEEAPKPAGEDERGVEIRPGHFIKRY